MKRVWRDCVFLRMAGSSTRLCFWLGSARAKLRKLKPNLQKELLVSRNLGRFTPLFLVPAVSWGPFGLPAWSPSDPQPSPMP